MRRRAENVTATHLRIVEATVALHGTVGPAATTVSAIAEAAGVTRLTVYRHFPDDEALFAACTAHWASGLPLPDPAGWAAEPDPTARLRLALGELYRFYRAGEPMLANAQRDRDALPERIRAGAAAAEEHRLGLLLGPFRARGSRRRRLRATVAHATSFGTWRSLCHEHGLRDEEAVDLMVALVSASASPGGP
jgi:AcrR family transcriptional regulator